MAIKSTSLNDSVAALRDLRVLEFVAGARIARLATADASGAPHNVPLCYWFDGERIYFAIDEKPKRQTGMQLKRMRNIVENPRVALLIDHYEEDWAQLGFVMIRGVARVVEDPQEYMAALRHLRAWQLEWRLVSAADILRSGAPRTSTTWEDSRDAHSPVYRQWSLARVADRSTWPIPFGARVRHRPGADRRPGDSWRGEWLHQR